MSSLKAIFAIGLWGIRVTQTQVVARAQEVIGYKFKDPVILLQSLTHASVAHSRLQSNERLEFLGDAILGLVVCEELYRRFPDYLEGELTKLKSAVVSRKTCARIADHIGLTPLLFLGKGINGQASVPLSLRAAVFEAIIAGIFHDGGFDAAQAFILQSASEFIDEAARSEHQENHKSILQQYVQKHLSLTPQYDQLDEQGPDHSKCFEICVTIGNRRFPAAWGPSKKEAEQRAAKLAMLEINPSIYENDDLDESREPADTADESLPVGNPT